jgi:hypothetical protein
MATTVSLPDGSLQHKLHGLWGTMSQALDLAALIERGQATMPIRDHLEALGSSLGTAPFTLTLMGTDAASRAAALGWLCGEDFHVLSVEVPGAVGLVEVQLAERGYVLVKSGRRQEFDRLEPFLDAVRAADLVRQGDASAWLEPMHLEVAAPKGLQGLKLLMPESPMAMVESPALLARLRSESNFLVLTGPTDHPLDEKATGAVRELAADAMATWALTCGPIPDPGDLTEGWPALLAGGTLPAVHLGPDTEAPPVPGFLRESRSGVRGALFACQQARRFDAALDMLEERSQQDLRQHEARRKMLLRRSTNLGAPGQDPVLREASDEVRRDIEDRLNRLQAGLAASQRERLLPTSIANNKIKNLLEDITGDDIAKETLGRIVQLSVAPPFREKVRRLVSDLVLADVQADLKRLNLELTNLLDVMVARLKAATGGNFVVPPIAMDESTVWKTLHEAIHLNSRYHTEVTQKGSRERIFEFVMHCRTPVFLMTVVASPIYSFWPDLRETMMKLSPLVLMGGAYWAYHGMQEEEHKTMEREVMRLRDTVGGEIRALYEQALRDWNDRATLHVREAGKRLGHQMEEHLKARAAELACASARERVEIQDKLKAVDNRLRELGGLVQQAARVRQAATEARQSLERAARDAIREVREPARAM